MMIKIGCDLVHIGKFQKSAERGGSSFLSRIFSDHELAHNPSFQSLAGLFAVKEAVLKALDLKAGSWKNIEILKSKSGRPLVKLIEIEHNFINNDVSISHDGDYAMAIVVFLLKS